MSDKELSLYIHIPFCVSKCDYCDFFSISTGCKKAAVPVDYIKALCNEIKYRFYEYPECRIKTVYIGGGTPSLLSVEQLTQISDVIKNIGLTSDYEFTFEVNPDDVNIELLAALEKCGVNRISCGIQSFNDNALKGVKRRADSITVLYALDLLENHWPQKLSIDLICGLPGETEESMLKGLELIVQKNISHISFYSLCIEDETPLGKAILSEQTPYDYDFSDKLWLKGRDFLLSKGYIQYEVSNFCKSGNECRHNMTYWTHKDYIGCGSGGTGTLYNKPMFSQKINKKGEGVRYTNIKNTDLYTSFWFDKDCKNRENFSNIPQSVEKIIHKTSKFEYFMMALRTRRGVSSVEYHELFDEQIPPELIKKLENNCRINEYGNYYLDKEKLIFLNVFLEEILDLID